MSLDLDEMAEHYRKALLCVVTGLFSLAGFAPPGGVIETMPRHLQTLIFRGLRCAESATRRLIMVYERRLKPLKSASRTRSKPSGPIPRGSGKKRKRAFQLLDPKRRGGGSGRKHPRGPGPQIRSLGYDWEPAPEPIKPAPMPDDEVSAESLRQRLEAVLEALGNPMKQARRLARLRARMKTKPTPVWPMRHGTPPGHKTEPKHGYTEVVDDILKECHRLGYRALKAPDTS